MAPLGHTVAQTPQPRHISAFTMAPVSPSEIAPVGQTDWQAAHRLHAVSSILATRWRRSARRAGARASPATGGCKADVRCIEARTRCGSISGVFPGTAERFAAASPTPIRRARPRPRPAPRPLPRPPPRPHPPPPLGPVPSPRGMFTASFRVSLHTSPPAGSGSDHVGGAARVPQYQCRMRAVRNADLRSCL